MEKFGPFYLKEVDGLPCVFKEDFCIYSLKTTSLKLFHGIYKVSRSNFISGCSEYYLFEKIRSYLRKSWDEKNDCDYLSLRIKHEKTLLGIKNLQYDIKELKGDKKNKYKDELKKKEIALKKLKAELPDILIRGRKAYHAANNNAIKITNRFVYKIREFIDDRILKLIMRFPCKHRSAVFCYCLENERYLQFLEVFPIGILFLENKDLILKGSKPNEIFKYPKSVSIFKNIKPQSVFFKLHNIELLIKNNPNIFTDFMPRDNTMKQFRWFKLILKTSFPLDFSLWLARASISQLGRKIEDLINEANLMLDAFRDKPWPLNVTWKGGMRRQEEWHEEILKRDFKSTIEFPDPFIPNWKDEKTGYSIKAIQDSFELYKEGLAMHHCVSSYKDAIMREDCCIYSVTKDGTRVGTLEINNDLEINQFKAYCNKEPLENDYKFVKKWLSKFKKKVA
jgi:hypothetical protein